MSKRKDKAKLCKGPDFDAFIKVFGKEPNLSDDKWHRWVEKSKGWLEALKWERKNNSTSDTCQKCGCNEFLCGHNKKG